MKQLIYFIISLGFAGGLARLDAIMINSFFTETHDRFANNPRFIADSFDLSGVGLTENGAWGTLLSPNVFITAIHFRPSDNSSLTFYKTNDPNGDSVSIKVKGETGMQIEDTDIWLGVLEMPVPSGYAYYDFAREEIRDSETFNRSPYAYKEAYIFGHSPTGFPYPQNVAVGRNVLEGLGEYPETGFSGHGFTSVMGGAHAVTYEAALERGDSGGPMFVSLQTGQLTLIGANWFIFYDLETHETTDNGYTYTGNYYEIIQNFIDQNMISERYNPETAHNLFQD